MKNNEITLRYKELQDDLFEEQIERIVLVHNLLDSQIIQRAFMGSDKLQMEFITENFLYKNVYLSYGYFDSIDDFINSLMGKFISFVYRKFNEINAIDIMLEYPIGTFYIESMPNKEKIEETLTMLEWYLNYLNTSSSPNNPEINKNFNVLLDFKISESKVHTLGVIVWVLLG